MKSNIEQAFALPLTDLQQIVRNFHEEMRQGLQAEAGSLKMLPAFLDRPDGSEKGHFLALDLGGTNFRVLLVSLQGNGRAEVKKSSKYQIAETVMQGTGADLFNFIALAIQRFLADHNIDSNRKIALGFTFSFPIDQTDIASGLLVTWTKGFSASGVVGHDVVRLLTDAFKRYAIDNIEITALANDTVGTLMAGSYNRPSCDMGVIFGTGTNACYRETTAAIVKLEPEKKTSAYMIVNIEWGNFNCLPVNQYDRALDLTTINPGKQQMEKMISGMYLGHLVQLVVMDNITGKNRAEDGIAPNGSKQLSTGECASFASDQSPELDTIKRYLNGIGMLHNSINDRQNVRWICAQVSQRAARISAAAISAVATWMDFSLEQQHTVAIDGTLYEKYPRFKETINKTLQELHGDRSRNLDLILSRDGSGTGAAIASAVAVEIGKRRKK